MTSEFRESCPFCHLKLPYIHNGKTYNRTIGIVIPGVYDGVLFWQCPNCEGRWHRFRKGTRERVKAEPFVNNLDDD